MEIEEIQEFTQSMIQIESFLSELAARDSELRYMGLGSAKLWQSYEEASESFGGFDRKLHELIKLSKFIDSDLHKRISDIASSSKVAEGITQIAVTVKVAKRRREREIAMRKVATSIADIFVAASARLFSTSITSNRSLTFKDFDVSLSTILVGLNRLIPLSREVEEIYEAKKLGDDEVFKPANINIDSINLYIENTLNIVSSSPDIGPDTKEKVLEYLEDIRLELAEKTPKWKKVVGGLVIVSTILAGIAVAPQAIENVQKATQEILGTAIEKSYPHRVTEGDKETPKLIMT